MVFPRGRLHGIRCTFQIVEPEEMRQKAGLTTPHTTHCLANGEIMISCLGDADENNKGL